jgi:hypothetical protein
MCRNIPELRGLEPPATREEIEAAARQYIRKVSGIAKPSETLAGRMEDAALEVAAITEQLLAEVPPRRQPPKTLPPLRRPEVRERLGLGAFPA